MDRIFSTRINDSIYHQINDLSGKMHKSKKAVIENAIKLLAQHFQQTQKINVFEETCGIWNRNEAPEQTVINIRSDFRKSMNRHNI